MNVIILAAGKGLRLKLPYPKPLVPICGRPILEYTLMALKAFAQKQQICMNTFVVVGHQREMISDFLKKFPVGKEMKLCEVVQEPPRGTGDAVLKATLHPDFKRDAKTLVMCGDTPFIRENEMETLYNQMLNGSYVAAVATTHMLKPTGLGRIVRSGNGISIIEEKHLSADQIKINEINTGLYIFDTSFLLASIKNINLHSETNEYYLTDVIKPDAPITPVLFPREEIFLGINDPLQLWEAQNIQFEVIRKRHLANGVHFLGNNHLIDDTVQIDPGTHIYPGVILRGNTTVGSGCILGAGSIVSDCQIAEQVEVKSYSVLESSIIDKQCTIGPFAHLRPQSHLKKGAKVGNFVELKKTTMGEDAKASHLSYLGDTDVGARTNIGCGFISANYDGENKHPTHIGADTFIGSNVVSIAPRSIGSECFIAASSTLTQDVPGGALAIARPKQVNKSGAASRFLKVEKSDKLK